MQIRIMASAAAKSSAKPSRASQSRYAPLLLVAEEYVLQEEEERLSGACPVHHKCVHEFLGAGLHGK